MLKHPEITKARLGRFQRELQALVYPETAPIAGLFAFSAPGRISYGEALKGQYRPAKESEVFGPDWSTHWFRIGYTVPSAWKGREVLLQFYSASEGCVWQDGVPIQGLTSYNWGPEDIRSRFTLMANANGGEEGVIYVEAAINGMFGLGDMGVVGKTKENMGLLRHVRLVVRDRAAWDFLWDFAIIKEMAEKLPHTNPHGGSALAAANEMVNVVTLGDSATYVKGRAIAKEFLSVRNSERNHFVSAIGHAHIDTAWLWPLAETKRKCYRTFATAVRMMDDYPEYKFACSQAQQLSWMKEGQPALYAKIKAKAAEGQFIPVGGTWIEPDCNIPSGESLARQFLMGQRFFKAEFGSYCREFWNPDVFGYSGALPQIILGAGIRFFMTQKLSWSQFNKPTLSTFLWEGIDGSRVLTHFPPADTYNAEVTMDEVLKHYSNFKEADRASESYMLFGFGDGGGGPTEDMLERLRRMKDVAGLPSFEIRTPQEFFVRCEEDIVDPAVWSGELYMENHRGTYTTQAATKRDNRRCEEALHNVEFVSVASTLLKGTAYPHQEINRLWEIVLLNQFHDIIPGSSIAEVYQDSAKDYAEVLESAHKLESEALKQILPEGTGASIVAVNTLGWPRREVVELAGGGELAFVEAPSYGYAVSSPIMADDAVSSSITDQGFVIENASVRAALDGEGRLISFFDKRQNRETLAAPGNQFVMFEDLPICEDAWNVEVYHLEKQRVVGQAISARVFNTGSLRAGIEIELEISPRASLLQRIFLEAESPRLNFEISAKWEEKNQFLKVEFPLALRSDHATYEIQFGHLQRPTHFNTSWDLARFEVCAHRWGDLSEPSFGVALLNDSKYGYACHENVLCLSLLRSPKSPDPTADMGSHHFRYALFPHPYGPQLGGVVREAAAFNQPLRVWTTSSDPRAEEFFRLNNPAIILDTVKKAEDSNDVIIRLYESHGGHQTAVLTTSLPFIKATRVNLLEEEAGGAAFIFTNGELQLTIRPFEIVSLKLSL